ncbi:MAG TPA: type II CRISPR RNA-guided endonuclease Cas9 [Candidatus Kapabacteria bacterium]|nr:type II CRISPR RNA-guided endonuclease Cas9 [Candidatus Kapabacteria bacterium]
MGLIYGFDLGVSSIGWSVIDPINEKIIDAGSRIFTTTLDDALKSGGVSQNTIRRENRLRRRNLFRKKYRLSLLIKKLKEYNFLPNDIDMSIFFKINPYEMRFKALNEEITTTELSRIFYLFAKRRGFLSSRKEEQSKDTKIDINIPETAKIGIHDNTKLAQEFGTIGNYFHSIYKADGIPYTYTERIRNRILTRKIIHNEFLAIWEKQAEYHPELMTNELRDLIGAFKKGIIFYQKPLKSQKFNIANCPLEPTKKRCYASHPAFEEFRAWQLVSNLRFGYNKIELSIQEKEKIIQYLSSKKGTVLISDIKKKLGKEKEVCNYDDKDRVKCMTSNYIINSTISSEYLDTLLEQPEKLEKLKADWWERLNYYNSNTKLLKFINNYPLNKQIIKEVDKFKKDQQAGYENSSDVEFKKAIYQFKKERILKIVGTPLEEGYASYSLKAIKNTLPFLRVGYNLYKSIIFGGLKNVLGERWNSDNYEKINKLIHDIDSILESYNNIEERNEAIKHLLLTTFNLNEKELSKLYFSKAELSETEVLDKLPPAPIIKNPTVMKILNQLRKIVNALIDEYGHPEKINIELARELKQTESERLETMQKNKKNEQSREVAKEYIERQGYSATSGQIQKYILFKELESHHSPVLSPYSGNVITLSDVFSSDNKIEIEHIIPYSISLDNSLANKTLCEAQINKEKGNMTPYQFFSSHGNWEEIKSRAFKIFPYKKAKKFVSEDIPELDNFISRQLNDTRYASKVSVTYLKEICKDVQVSTGQITSSLRKLWGLNSILSTSEDEEEKQKKNRENHKHHAIDAIVIALIDKKMLYHVSNNAYRNEERLRVKIKEPWNNFRVDVQDKIEQVLISHEFNDKVLALATKTDKLKGSLIKYRSMAVRGQLHKETVYGKGKDPYDNKEYYYIRKNVAGLTPNQINSIASREIRDYIISKLDEENISVDKTKGIPASFVYSLDGGIRTPKLFLKNKRGDEVPIWKVRIKIVSSSMQERRNGNGEFVEPGSNHHTAIYRDANGKLKEEMVTFWEASQRAANGLPVINKDKYGTLVSVIKVNYMYIIGSNLEEILAHRTDKRWISKRLYRGQTISSNDFRFRIHIAAKVEYKHEGIRIRSLGQLMGSNPIRVQVDILGNISKIYD